MNRGVTAKESTQYQLRFDELCAEFLLPLLSGRDRDLNSAPIQLGRALTPGMYSHFTFATPSDTDVEHELFSALHESASAIAPVRRVPWPDPGFAAIAMACHNLLFLTDPKLDRAGSRAAIDAVAGYTDQILDACPFPRTRGEHCVRHAVVSRVVDLHRTDVTIKNWAAVYKVEGRPVPKHLLRLPRLRFTRQTRETQSFLELGANNETLSQLWQRIVRSSPITSLVYPEHSEHRFATPELSILSDDVARNGIAQLLCARGPKAISRTEQALYRFFTAEEMPRVFAYFPLALVIETHLNRLQERNDVFEDAAWLGMATPYFHSVFVAALQEDSPLLRANHYGPAQRARIEKYALRLSRPAFEDVLGPMRTIVRQVRVPREFESKEFDGKAAPSIITNEITP